MRERRRGSRFGLGLLIYCLVFLLLAGAALFVLKLYLQAYEDSRSGNCIDRFLLSIITFISASCPAAAMHEHQYRDFFSVCLRRHKYIHAQLTRRTVVIFDIGHHNIPIGRLHIDEIFCCCAAATIHGHSQSQRQQRC